MFYGSIIFVPGRFGEKYITLNNRMLIDLVL